MSKDVADFFAQYDAPVAALCDALRAFVRAQTPSATETLHLGWKVVSYGTKKKFCAIAPHAKWANLQFHAGASLDDPSGLLSGTGKSMRHVKIESLDQLDSRLSDLIQHAAQASQ